MNMTTEDKINRLVGNNPNTVVISFNDHWVVYESVEKMNLPPYRWVNDAERALGIASNSAWSAIVYDLDSEMLVNVTASTLGAALDAALCVYPGEPSEWAGDMQRVDEWVAWAIRGTGHHFEMRFDAEEDPHNIWQVAFYPNTPVGYCSGEAPRLDQAIYWLSGDYNPFKKPWLDETTEHPS